MSNTWNYRVVRHKSQREGWPDHLQIHEVHYENDKPVSVSADGARIGGDNVDEIKWALERIREALEKPILEYDSFN